MKCLIKIILVVWIVHVIVWGTRNLRANIGDQPPQTDAPEIAPAPIADRPPALVQPQVMRQTPVMPQVPSLPSPAMAQPSDLPPSAVVPSVLAEPSVAAATPTTRADKLWLTDFPGFLSAHPHQHWVIGRSTKVALSPDEAEIQARQDAAAQIAAGIDPALRARMDPRKLRDSITSAIDQQELAVDRQIEATERPYATIWKAEILVDADPAHFQPVTQTLQRQINQHRTIIAIAGGFAIVWVTIVGLGFMMLNWLTRGYFRGRIAMFSMLLLVIGFIGAVQLVKVAT